MDAERIIEWITNVMDVHLTWNQEQLIRNYCEHRIHGMIPTDTGYKFAEVLVDAYHKAEEEVHIQQDMARQMLKGNSVDEAIMDEVARIPDLVFLPGEEEEEKDV